MSKTIDKKFRKAAEKLAQSTSRRSFLFKLTAAMALFGSNGLLLPANRATAEPTPQPCDTGNCCKAKGIHGNNAGATLNNDPNSDKYWLFAGMEGKPCAWGCCGASAGSCPTTIKDRDGKDIPVTLAGCWTTTVSDCDGQNWCVAYVDCCTHTLTLRTAGPCESEAGCTRINGVGRSWCGNRIPSTTGTICDGPGFGNWTFGHAVCTQARKLAPGNCETDYR